MHLLFVDGLSTHFSGNIHDPTAQTTWPDTRFLACLLYEGMPQAATHKRFNIIPERTDPIIIRPYDTQSPEALVSEGPATAEILRPWGDLPARLRIDGELFFAKNHVYGRFTRAHLPNGELVPVCLQVRTSKGLGIAMEPGSTPEQARVSNIMSIQPVSHFE